MKHLVVPNDSGNVILKELHRRLDEEQSVTIAFGGSSMKPLINGDGDRIVLRKVLPNEPLHRGTVYLFEKDGHCVVHRLIGFGKDSLLFRGDNCMRVDEVSRQSVWARLAVIVKPDGRCVDCTSFGWLFKSGVVCMFRGSVNLFVCCFGKRQRQWQRWLYFFILLVLMWAPMGLVGIPLNNFVLGIRMDHLLHASVYIPCVPFLMDFKLFTVHQKNRSPRYRKAWIWLAGVAIALTTETVQYFLPYRGFDINDIVANVMGVSMGWVMLCAYSYKSYRKNP